MQEAIRYLLQAGYENAIRDANGRLPSPIQLRRETRGWFYSRFGYAKHHINPVCRAAIAMLRSHRKNRGALAVPEVKRLVARIDAETFKVINGRIRITLQPYHYVWIPINTKNKHYQEYSAGRPSELLITDKKVCLSFRVGNSAKSLGQQLTACDLNFKTIDSTSMSIEKGSISLGGVRTESIRNIIRVQNDFSRRRRAIQLHVENPEKRNRKLRETRGRQKNRVKDVMHKLSSRHVRENPNASFVFERLTGIRDKGAKEESRSRKFSEYLNRWPYRMYQSMVEYKSPNRTIYVSPRGTSSECPVCGGKLEHPTWAMSRCAKCGADYDRNRLASLAILRRGLRLCGQPFAVSADASWKALMDEYLYTADKSGVVGPGWTEPSNAPNLIGSHEKPL